MIPRQRSALMRHWPEYLMETALLVGSAAAAVRRAMLVRDPDGHVVQLAKQ